MLSNEDASKLAAVGTDLGRLGLDLLVPFQARQLVNPRPIWINRRWFASTLARMLTEDQWDQISAWLIKEFGYIVPRPEDPSSNFTRVEKTFYADRYGDDGLTPHGGSGRVGIHRTFQVKGIGITPLVGRDADWLHQHGCVWLEEALREAILGEIVDHEFPLGAVPVIAILDTGLEATFALDSPDRRRVLLIRPSCSRPAHMQRAPLFRPLTGTLDEAQRADGRRSRQAVLGLAGNHEMFQDTLDKAAKQMAYAYVHRIYLGGMLSSNWTMKGQVVDFGGLSAVADWEEKPVSPGLPPFGREHVPVEDAIEAILHRAKRFIPLYRPVEFEVVRSSFRSSLHEATQAEFKRLFPGCEGSPRDLLCTARRLPYQMHDRKLLIRERLQSWIRLSPAVNSRWAYALIANCLTNVRRDWPLLPKGATAVAQHVANDTSAVVYKLDEQFGLYLESEGGGTHVDVFGARIPASMFKSVARNDRAIYYWAGSFNVISVQRLNLPDWTEWFAFCPTEFQRSRMTL